MALGILDSVSSAYRQAAKLDKPEPKATKTKRAKKAAPKEEEQPAAEE